MSKRKEINITLENAKCAITNLINLLGEFFVATFETFEFSLKEIEFIQRFITDITNE